jgi:glycosyltransferase involved in cell wall biosynthesis
LDSLIKQSYKDFTWVIVNDNGDKEDVELVFKLALANKIEAHVIHRDSSIGVAAAANHGINESKSEFIHIHDDDDTLESDFYLEMIKFLDKNGNYMGVISCSNRVDEEMRGDVILINKIYRYYNFDSTLFIADMLWRNQYSPISFVYRRIAFDEIGLYDEKLPVLEDWDFNLRFLSKFDIGVVSQFLANYHWRVGVTSGGNAQTVTSGALLHQEYTALIRNKLVRRDIEDGRFGIGALMTLGRFHQLNSNTLKVMNDKLDAQMILRRLVKKVIVAFKGWR